MKFVEVAPDNGCRGFVAELRDAKVIGDMRLAATAVDVVLGDLQFLHGAADPARHWVLEQVRFRLPQKLRGTAMLLEASNGDNYYHWLFHSLPRLRLLELAGYAFNEVEHFLLKHDEFRFHTQSLDLLGIPAARRRRCAKRKILQVERLLATSMPGPVGEPPLWISQYLREKFLPQTDAVPLRKIYISRRLSQGRVIVNESQILPLLARHGYEIVFPERLMFREQVALFASAKKIIATHGAGLANLAFAPPGVGVLELCSPAHFNSIYRTIAAGCGLRHDQFQLAAANPLEKDRRLANLVIDPEAFGRKLEQFD